MPGKTAEKIRIDRVTLILNWKHKSRLNSCVNELLQDNYREVS